MARKKMPDSMNIYSHDRARKVNKPMQPNKHDDLFYITITMVIVAIAWAIIMRGC
jgi:hypothetical protein